MGWHYVWVTWTFIKIKAGLHLRCISVRMLVKRRLYNFIFFFISLYMLIYKYMDILPRTLNNVNLTLKYILHEINIR